MSHAKKQQHTRGEKIEVLLEHMDHVIVTARGSDLNQAIADMIVIREELEAFRPTHYSNFDSSSSDSESNGE
jgi:DNA-binding protein